MIVADKESPMFLSMQAKYAEAMNEVRRIFPSMDKDVDTYLEGIITENGDHFESPDEVFEAVGSFLEGSNPNLDVSGIKKLCTELFQILRPDGEVDGPTALDEPVHMASLVNNFNDRVINTSSIWMAKREKAPSVNQKKLAKAEAKLKGKMTKKSSSNDLSKTTTNPQSDTACVSQQPDRKTADASTRKVTDIHIENFDITFGSSLSFSWSDNFVAGTLESDLENPAWSVDDETESGNARSPTKSVRVLLEGASLHLALGRRYGLIGRNGYGKTTLLRALAW
ncbi:unnamed protein product [Dibothriocephalus latus]|uniref:Uncharacterized protein n=1 Tax=Dibothriocephalus latus TaxID=60516 RepID=A0A3P7KXH8_DIBLA|nr:unnamed protein product [Dibothriocephalus latus]